jgi:hypothetical protein
MKRLGDTMGVMQVAGPVFGERTVKDCGSFVVELVEEQMDYVVET